MEELAVEFSKTQIKRGEEEAEAIKNESSPEILLKIMRGKCDPLNYVLLHSIKLIKKAKTNTNYCEKLVEIIDDIRSPYALSLVCILIGFLGRESDVELLLRKHAELKSLYLDHDYEQGALLGIIELRERFNLLRR